MPINCTANLSLYTNDLDDISGDIGRVAVVGWLLFVPQFTDGAAALGDDAAYVLRGGLADNRSGGFKGYIDSDGILKDKPGGTAGVRIWANDPALNLERLVYRAVPDGLTDLIGRPIALNRITFEAPSTDTPINLKSVMAVPLATSVGITRGPKGAPVDDVAVNTDGDLVFYVGSAPIGDPVPIPAGSGVVNTLVAGANIDVDATDPANPIVSVETLTSLDISDFTEAAQDAINALLVGASGVTLSYNDAANTLTITAAGGGGGLDAEAVRDAIGVAMVGAGLITITVNDAADTITVSTTATANSSDATLLARANHTGTQSADTLTDGTTNKAFLATERTKLTAITGTNTGDQTSVTGNAGTATKLATPRNINGVAFDGTANITVADSTKEATANKGAANGYAPLDGSSLVPAVNLPSYVDDVLEYANLAAMAGNGVTGKIFVALDTNKTYRWSGSAFVEISPSPGSTDSVTEGSSNLYYTNARADARIAAATATGTGSIVRATSPALTTPTGIVKADVGLGNVDNTSNATERAATATLGGKTLTNPTVTNYVETAQTKATVTTAKTLDPTTGTVIPLQLTASTACIVAMPTAAAGKSLLVPVYQALTTGAGTVTFTGVKWAGGTAPTMTSTAAKMDLFSFWSDGTVWFGTVAQNFTP